MPELFKLPKRMLQLHSTKLKKLEKKTKVINCDFLKHSSVNGLVTLVYEMSMFTKVDVAKVINFDSRLFFNVDIS